jgi:CubicO group peptidase (beta-lactamase class C family)
MAADIDLTKPREEIIKGIANFAAGKSLSFEPGAEYQYSNTNYTLLGLIIEKVSATPLEEFYRWELFDPLKMKSTKLLSLPDAIKFQLSPESTEYPVRYFVTPTGGKPHFTEVKPDYIMVPFADGGVVSTTSDLIKWYKGLHRGKVLSEDSYKLMTKKHYLAPNKVGVTNYTGYGMFISELNNGEVVYHHAGSAIAIRSESGYIPSRQFYYAVISNVMNHIPKEAKDKIDMNLPANQLDIHYFMQAIFNAIGS